MDEEKPKKKFNWGEFIVIIVLVALTAVVTWGITWYIMDNQMQDVRADYDAQVKSLHDQIDHLEAKQNTEAETAEPLTLAMVQNGTYTLGGVNVTLVGGTATVGANTYVLDTSTVAFTTDKTKAAVVIKETTGTPATTVNTYVATVVNSNGKSSQVASIALPSTTTVTAATYGSDGKVTVTTTTTSSATPVTTIYTVSGTALVKS